MHIMLYPQKSQDGFKNKETLHLHTDTLQIQIHTYKTLKMRVADKYNTEYFAALDASTGFCSFP